MSDYISRETIKDTMLRYGFKAPDMTVTEFVEDELPAADVEPVRHGEWLRTDDDWSSAIEILNPEHREHYDGMDEVNEACRMGMEALKRTRWIPVSERLPEDKIRSYLCWYEYFRYGSYNAMYQTCGIGYYCNGRWGGEVAQGQKAKVLAWMPLPELPKEENDETIDG